jgi:hypothetical protein
MEERSPLGLVHPSSYSKAPIIVDIFSASASLLSAQTATFWIDNLVYISLDGQGNKNVRIAQIREVHVFEQVQYASA